MTNREFAEMLIEKIELHKQNVSCGNPFTDNVYATAHDHIIELIKLEVELCEVKEKNG